MVSALVVVSCDIGPSLLENRSGRTMIVRLSELNNERAVRAYLRYKSPFGDVQMLAVRKYLLPRIDSFIPVPMSGFVYYSKVESAGWLERDEMEKMSSRKGLGWVSADGR